MTAALGQVSLDGAVVDTIASACMAAAINMLFDHETMPNSAAPHRTGGLHELRLQALSRYAQLYFKITN